MKYKNAAIVCAAAGCLFILLAVVCGGAVRWCAMAAALVCLGYLAVQYAHCAADMDALRRQSGEKMLHPLGRELADALEKREISQREAYTAAVSSSQSKINALQNQINPHFLYNTLECIRSEAILQDCENIARMSHALASFFRYSISRKENIVTLRDELSNIKNYFFIQQFRFEDRFFLDIQVEDGDDELLDCLLPKMTLQPIVENAFKHGVSYSKPSFIHMRIDYADGKVVSTIGNSLHSPQAEKHNAGIGLENVRKRLSLIYGPKNYSLDIEETKETYTVKLVIPTLNA